MGGPKVIMKKWRAGAENTLVAGKGDHAKRHGSEEPFGKRLRQA
jgi:hypothetical protein